MVSLLNGQDHFGLSEQSEQNISKLIHLKKRQWNEHFIDGNESETPIHKLKKSDQLNKIKSNLKDPKFFLSMILDEQFDDIFQQMICSNQLSFFSQTVKVNIIRSVKFG
jgi:hypothetical protein